MKIKMESTDFLGKIWKYNCMGCSIVSRKLTVPGDILFESKHFLVHQDPNNPIPGFIIIAHKRHIEGFSKVFSCPKPSIIDILCHQFKNS